MCHCWKINHSHCSVRGGAVCDFITEEDPVSQLENCQSNSFPIQWRHHHHRTSDSRYKFLVGKRAINTLSVIVHKAHNTMGDPELGLQRVGATVEIKITTLGWYSSVIWKKKWIGCDCLQDEHLETGNAKYGPFSLDGTYLTCRKNDIRRLW